MCMCISLFAPQRTLLPVCTIYICINVYGNYSNISINLYGSIKRKTRTTNRTISIYTLLMFQSTCFPLLFGPTGPAPSGGTWPLELADGRQLVHLKFHETLGRPLGKKPLGWPSWHLEHSHPSLAASRGDEESPCPWVPLFPLEAQDWEIQPRAKKVEWETYLLRHRWQ